MPAHRRASWQLPPGVSRGARDYVDSAHIAEGYDRDLADSPLLRLDLEFVAQHLPPVEPQRAGPLIADFACGTGRVARELLPRGYRLLNVDLSRHMLNQLQRHLQTEQQGASVSVRGNLAQLDWLRSESLDMAVCLFSSLGMIRGRHHRHRFLSDVHRGLRQGGALIVHAHNRTCSWSDPRGPSWLLHSRWKSLTSEDWEFGDRIYSYLGLPSMFLHIFSRRELARDLRRAGFASLRIEPIDRTGGRLLPKHPLVGLRAGGYFAVARKGQ